MVKTLETFPEYKTAFLEVGISNHNVITLYLKFGFESSSSGKSYYSKGEDA